MCITSSRRTSGGTLGTPQRPVDGTVDPWKHCTQKSSYLGIHHIRCNICVGDMFAKFAPQFGLDLLEVQRYHISSRTSVNPRLVADDIGPQRFWEAANRLTEISLEELDDRRGEIKPISTVEDISLGQRILCHPLSEVSNNLG